MCITLEDAPKACELLLGDDEPGDVNAAAVVLSLSRHHTSAMSVQLLHHVAAQVTKGLNSCRVLEVVDGRGPPSASEVGVGKKPERYHAGLGVRWRAGQRPHLVQPINELRREEDAPSSCSIQPAVQPCESVFVTEPLQLVDTSFMLSSVTRVCELAR